MLQDLIIKYNDASDKASYDSFLRHYYALWNEAMRVDPTDQKFIKNMGDPQAYIEGSARYVENQYLLSVGFEESPILSVRPEKAKFKDYYRQLQFYSLGALVFKALKGVGVDINDMGKPFADNKNEFQYPYNLTKRYVKLDDEQTAKALEEAKQALDYAGAKKDAQAFLED